MQYKIIYGRPLDLKHQSKQVFKDGWQPLREYVLSSPVLDSELVMILQKEDEEN